MKGAKKLKIDSQSGNAYYTGLSGEFTGSSVR